jgi:hypothetical protein
LSQLRQGGGILLLWHDRLPVDQRATATEIMKIATLRGFAFDLDYTLSRASVLAARFLRFAAKPPGRFGFTYPLKLSAFVAGTSLAAAARLMQPLGSRRRPYLTENCSSLAVDQDVSRRSIGVLPHPGYVARRRALLARAPSDVYRILTVIPSSPDGSSIRTPCTSPSWS